VTAGFALKKLLNEPEGLASLIEISRRLCGNSVTAFCDLEKLCLTGTVGAALRFLKSQVGIAASISDDRFAAFDHGLKEVLAAEIVSVTDVELGESLTGLSHNALKTLVKNLGVVNVDVTDTVVEVVTYGEHSVIQEDVENFGIHRLCRKIAYGLALPVRIYLLKSFNGGGGYIERVGLTGSDRVVFFFEPLEGVFGEGLASAGGDRVTTYDKLLGTDNYRNILHNVAESLGATLHDGKSFGLLIAFGDQLGSVCLDLGHISVEVIDEPLNSGALIYYKFDLTHNKISIEIFAELLSLQ
jgi:hypothetical protein